MQYTVKMDSLCGKKESDTESDSVSDVLCPMPSTITSISVKNGDHVKKGDVLLVIEAMKMEVSSLKQPLICSISLLHLMTVSLK